MHHNGHLQVCPWADFNITSSQTSKVNSISMSFFFFFFFNEDVSFRHVKWKDRLTCPISVSDLNSCGSVFGLGLFLELCWSAWSQGFHTAESIARTLRPSAGQGGEAEASGRRNLDFSRLRHGSSAPTGLQTPCGIVGSYFIPLGLILSNEGTGVTR